MKVSKDFDIREFVHPDVYRDFGASSMWFVDKRLVAIDQALRDRFGPAVINNWHFWKPGMWYGPNKRVDSGFSPNRAVGGKMSQHKFGNATDSIYKDATADEVRADILANQSKWLEMGLTTIEDGAFAPTWVHKDTRWTGLKHILVVKPRT